MDYKLILNKVFSNRDSSNIILSGNSKIDKMSILYEYISKENIKLNKYGIDYISNPYYKIFDINKYKKNIDNFFKLLIENIQCKNYYYNNQKIVILKNFNLVSINIQNKFRVIFEKYRITTLFFIITDKLNSIIQPIISRFLIIRIKDKIRTEKREISREYLKDLSYPDKSKVYDKIYSLFEKTDIINYSKNYEGIINNHEDIYKIITNIIKNIKNINHKTFKIIKELSYLIEKYNIKEFHKEILYLLTSDLRISLSINDKLCKCVADSEYNYINCDNKILSNENFILSLVNIINLMNHEEVYRY